MENLRTFLRVHLPCILLLAAGILFSPVGPEAGEADKRKIDIATDGIKLSRQSRILLVYIGSWDCPPCLAWKRNVKPEWVSSPEFAQIDYREVETPSFKEPLYEPSWPADLRWLVDKGYFVIGVPRFVILVDGKVVGNKPDWPMTYNQIKNLLAKRAAGS